jgi:pyruvate ferredoxin oxidoreductase alpha subunit
MTKKVGMEVCAAIAEAVKLSDVDVVAAYPITPQTHIIERIADLVANGELPAAYIPVESEHSALSACLGSSAVGARTFTATAGQGLELMHEVLYVASSMRLPMVMAVANRALSAPLCIWGDHSDAMAVRDTGWIQMFVENGQQAVDQVICGFRISEDQRVLLPLMIHADGFHLTHMVEPVEMPTCDEVQKFLPPYRYPLPLDPDKPVTMGAFGPPNVYTEAKWAQYEHFKSVKEVVKETWEAFGKTFGRQYKPVESYRAEEADVLLFTEGSYSETAMDAIDKARAAGKKVGLLRLRLWRPFPYEEICEAVGDAATLIVLDRSLAIGGMGGPVCADIRLALANGKKKTEVVGFVGGLGGRDISVEGFEEMIEKGMKLSKQSNRDEIEFYGVKE